MRVVAGIVGAVMATSANAGPIEDAMKKVGPAYMCGPTYEYNEALDALRLEIVRAGVPATLAQYAVDGVDRFVKREHAAKRDTISAQDCAEKYGAFTAATR